MATKPASKVDTFMRVPMQSVVVPREGKMMSPPVGIPFQFKKEEIEQIEAMNPDAISKIAAVDVAEGTGGEEV